MYNKIILAFQKEHLKQGVEYTGNGMDRDEKLNGLMKP